MEFRVPPNTTPVEKCPEIKKKKKDLALKKEAKKTCAWFTVQNKHELRVFGAALQLENRLQ